MIKYLWRWLCGHMYRCDSPYCCGKEKLVYLPRGHYCCPKCDWFLKTPLDP